MELEARSPKFSVPTSHRKVPNLNWAQVKNPIVQSCLILQMPQLPTSFRGGYGERLVELQMPSETIPHKLWVEMKNERLSTEAWPPATCTPKQHQKLLSHNNLHISCATTSASHPVNTFLPLKKSGHTKLPAHCQPLPLPIHPSRFTLVSIPKTWIRSYHSHG